MRQIVGNRVVEVHGPPGRDQRAYTTSDAQLFGGQVGVGTGGGTGGGTGPQGPPGPASAWLQNRTADVSLSGHQAIKFTATGADLASNLDAASRELSVGVSTVAAVAGAAITVQVFGLLAHVGWAWTPGGILFLGAAGALTQVMPTTPAFCRIIGTAISATEIWIDPQPPVVLS